MLLESFLPIKEKRMSKFANVRLRAKDLGITPLSGPGVTIQYLEDRIREVQEGKRQIERKPKKKRLLISKKGRATVTYDTDKMDAEYVVISGRHVFLDDQLVDEVQASLGEERDQVPGELVFYHDGERIVSLPGEEEVAEIYRIEAEENIKMHPQAIGFRSEFPDWLRIMLEKLLPIGGLYNATSSGMIESDGIKIQFYDYDTYA